MCQSLTLGRQVVRRALDEGYDVRCLVRPRMNPADFLRDWGATTVSGDLTKPETLPAAFVGIHTVVGPGVALPLRQLRWHSVPKTLSSVCLTIQYPGQCLQFYQTSLSYWAFHHD